MERYTVIGVDPGLAHCGIAIVADEEVVYAEVFVSEPSNKKLGISGVQHDSRRAIALACTLDRVVRQYQPHVLVFEEIPFLRSCTATAKVALACGVVVAVSVLRGIPVVSISPKDVRMMLGVKQKRGTDKKQKKDRLATALSEKINTLKVQELEKALQEHAFDAAAIAVAGSYSFHPAFQARSEI